MTSQTAPGGYLSTLTRGLPPLASITAVALIVPKPGSEENLLALLEEMAAAATDDGTEVYSVSRTRKAPVRYYIYEVYRDREALAAHQANPALAEAGKRLRDLVESVDVLLGEHVAGDAPPSRA
jgi:quinol monooxygenase YgiN